MKTIPYLYRKMTLFTVLSLVCSFVLYPTLFQEKVYAQDKNTVNPDPAAAKMVYNRANVLMQRKEYGSALITYADATKLDPKLTEAWIGVGMALTELGHPIDALGYYGQALKLNPKHPDALLNKGIALVTIGKYTDALETFETELKLYPNDVEAWNNKGIALMKLKKFPEALQAYDQH
jgi:tetratricopeptide (TPR) repeat protein